jgi:bifunctional non-homologous end joining protein LigD
VRRATSQTRPAAAAALPLSIPPPSALPADVAVEVAVPCSAPFDAEDWRFSVDWDGIRVLLATAPRGETRIRDERRREIGDRFPEVLAEVGAALGDHTAVVDGVITVLDPSGRPDLEALSRRRAGEAGVATVFIATDLLHLDGTWLLQRPFRERLQALESTVGGQPHLQVPEWVAGEGCALAEAATAQGLPAILARQLSAAYGSGVASAQRLRIALEDRADTVVTAVVRGAAGEAAWLLLGEQSGGRLVDAGRLAVALPPSVERWLQEQIETLATPTQSCRSAITPPGRVTWLQPELVATIRHDGRLAGGQPRRPELVALRDDRDPAWCVRRAPVPPPAGEEPHRGFRPTVLHTLPFLR